MSGPPVPYHGAFRRSVKRALVLSSIASVVGYIGWKHFVTDARQKKYAEFYKNYDAKAEAKKMKELGVFNPYGQPGPHETLRQKHG